TVSQMVDRTLELPEGTRLYLLAPIVRGRKGEFRKEFAELLKNGYQRVKVNGEFHELEDAPKLDKKFKHDIDVVVDRIVVKNGIEQRLAESFETSLSLAQGIAVAEYADLAEGEKEPKRVTFSANFACPVSGFSIPEIEPRLFSFNNPFGACPACDGIGTEQHCDPELVTPNPLLSLRDGAIAPWAGSSSAYYAQTLDGLCRHYGVSMKTPFGDLDAHVRDAILFGTGDEIVPIKYDDGLRSYTVKKPFEGVVHNLERRWRETDSAWIREELSRFMTAAPCHVCEGKRLKPEALAVKVARLDISAVSDFSVAEARNWFAALPEAMTAKHLEIGERILKEINERLGFLVDVGLGYLTLSRKSGSLSGGESQRIRLASQIGSGLTGVLYVLDEPSIGLHQRDNARLLATLTRLRDLGNTVIVVEHDEDAIRQADYVVDMGPAAGVHGGQVVAAGPPEAIMASAASMTGQYLTGMRQIPVPAKRRKGDGRALVVRGASGNNLKQVDATFPLGVFTCVTGVSGGGKSTLVIDTLYKALARRVMGARGA
ncbi:MAG: excinuclease ABC subunit A, partial [Alphaproteobacteria bacterium]